MDRLKLIENNVGNYHIPPYALQVSHITDLIALIIYGSMQVYKLRKP
jgi:hypothetical protein